MYIALIPEKLTALNKEEEVAKRKEKPKKGEINGGYGQNRIHQFRGIILAASNSPKMETVYWNSKNRE